MRKPSKLRRLASLNRNLPDEIRILTDERLKRLDNILGGKVVQADLHDERTNKRLLTKDTVLGSPDYRAHFYPQPEAN